MKVSVTAPDSTKFNLLGYNDAFTLEAESDTIFVRIQDVRRDDDNQYNAFVLGVDDNALSALTWISLDENVYRVFIDEISITRGQ